jgi:hypothetical protein
MIAQQVNDKQTLLALLLRTEELEEPMLENGPRDQLLYGRREGKVVEAVPR